MQPVATCPTSFTVMLPKRHQHGAEVGCLGNLRNRVTTSACDVHTLLRCASEQLLKKLCAAAPRRHDAGRPTSVPRAATHEKHPWASRAAHGARRLRPRGAPGGRTGAGLRCGAVFAVKARPLRTSAPQEIKRATKRFGESLLRGAALWNNTRLYVYGN